MSMPIELWLEVFSYLPCCDRFKIRLINSTFAAILPVSHLIHRLESPRFETISDEASCSMDCLRQLMNDKLIDPNCPRYYMHAKHVTFCKFPYHSVSRACFAESVKEHFIRSSWLEDHDLDSTLELYGRQEHFSPDDNPDIQIVLAARAYCPKFMHVAEDIEVAYRRVEDLQGDFMPVFLGSTKFAIVRHQPDWTVLFEALPRGKGNREDWVQATEEQMKDALIKLEVRGINSKSCRSEARINDRIGQLSLRFDLQGNTPLNDRPDSRLLKAHYLKQQRLNVVQ